MPVPLERLNSLQAELQEDVQKVLSDIRKLMNGEEDEAFDFENTTDFHKKWSEISRNVLTFSHSTMPLGWKYKEFSSEWRTSTCEDKFLYYPADFSLSHFILFFRQVLPAEYFFVHPIENGVVVTPLPNSVIGVSYQATPDCFGSSIAPISEQRISIRVGVVERKLDILDDLDSEGVRYFQILLESALLSGVDGCYARDQGLISFYLETLGIETTEKCNGGDLLPQANANLAKNILREWIDSGVDDAENGWFYCPVCQEEAGSLENFSFHVVSSSHKNRVIEKRGAPLQFFQIELPMLDDSFDYIYIWDLQTNQGGLR
jgi:hypothetical protein